ncbi:hypothetical protein FRC06_009001, partial [Ceratobasidium sp. 370]
MKMLVKAERRNRLLETKLGAAKAAEQQLRDQVQTLEAEASRSQLPRVRNTRSRTKPSTVYDFGGASEQVPPFNLGERRHEQIEGRAWQEVSASIRPGSGYEQRKELLRRNLESIICEPGATTPLNVAMDTMRLLVKVEKSNQVLEEKLETARTTEARLRNYIRYLEGRMPNGEYAR